MLVKPVGPKNAKIYLVGEAPGDAEDRTGRPFVGSSGRKLTTLLRSVGISTADCRINNVVDLKPPGNDMQIYYKDKRQTNPTYELLDCINNLTDDIKACNPNIVVALGRHALQALTGKYSIKNERGFLTTMLGSRIKVLPTMCPSSVLDNPKLTFPVIMDLRKVVKEATTDVLKYEDPKINVVMSLNQFIRWLDDLYQQPKQLIACDLEATLNGQHIDIIGIGTTDISVSFQTIKNHKPLYSPESEYRVYEAVAKVLGKHENIYHNGMYDALLLWHTVKIKCNYKHDTMIMGYAMWPEQPRSLNFLTSICCNVASWKQSNKSDTIYNAKDVGHTMQCFQTMIAQGAYNENIWVIEQKTKEAQVAMALQHKGIPVDTDVRDRLIQETKMKIMQLEIDLSTSTGQVINVKSPKQLSILLYDELKLPVQYKRRKSAQQARKPTTDAEAMVNLYRKTKNDVLKTILDLKRAYKQLTFLDVSLSKNKTVHTSYNIVGSKTASLTKHFVIDNEKRSMGFGRWSSSGSLILPYGSGNLQNIPYPLRKMYKYPDEDILMLTADYKQAEAVVSAYEMGDPVLINMFEKSYGKTAVECKKNHWDVHIMKAAAVSNVAPEDVTSDQRDIGKRLNHAVNYSAGPNVLVANLGITFKEAKNLLDREILTCPNRPIWHHQIQEQLRHDRTLINLFGVKHTFLDHWGDTLFRSAYSFIPQSTIGYLLNLALVRLYNTHSSTWLTPCLQLHDAIYAFVPRNRLVEGVAKFEDAMLGVQPLYTTKEKRPFYVDIDFSVGRSWGELKSFEYHDVQEGKNGELDRVLSQIYS